MLAEAVFLAALAVQLFRKQEITAHVGVPRRLADQADHSGSSFPGGGAGCVLGGGYMTGGRVLVVL